MPRDEGWKPRPQGHQARCDESGLERIHPDDRLGESRLYDGQCQEQYKWQYVRDRWVPCYSSGQLMAVGLRLTSVYPECLRSALSAEPAQCMEAPQDRPRRPA